MARQTMKTSERRWLNANTVYEGFPLYMRRPDVRVAEFAGLRPTYPRLLVLTHKLKHVRENGLPDGDYNDSLIMLSSCVTSPFDDETRGLIAVIETFAGKRTYYIYLAPSFDADAFVRGIKDRFPDEEFAAKVHEDPAWKFFHGYAGEFQFA